MRPAVSVSRRRVKTGAALFVALVVGVAILCAYVWRAEIWRTTLDPKQPYPTYRPPPAPDYAAPSAWLLRPADPAHAATGGPAADVFFVHPTAYAGGREWNAPIHDPKAEALLQQVVLPNYAGPFQRVGRVFAPRYRAASLFAYLTLRDDARDARRFAYGDVRRAFGAMLAQDAPGRPILIAGVGQGGSLALRLLQERVLRDPAVLQRIAGVYLMDTPVAADALPVSGPLSACRARAQAACTVAWASVPADDPQRGRRRLARALTWTPDGRLANLGGRPTLCVNPLTGGTDQPSATAKASRGAANATGLEWGARPAFLAHEVSAACRAGLLQVSAPLALSLQPTGGLFGRRKLAPFNLFYADVEADALARVQAWSGGGAALRALPITSSQSVGRAALHSID